MGQPSAAPLVTSLTSLRRGAQAVPRIGVPASFYSRPAVGFQPVAGPVAEAATLATGPFASNAERTVGVQNLSTDQLI